MIDQHLYGDETLRTVRVHSGNVVEGLNATKAIPLNVVLKLES